LAAVALGAVAIAAGLVMFRPRMGAEQRGAPITPMLFSLPASNSWYDGVTVSPDGRFLTYGVARDNFFELSAIDVVTPGAKPIGLATGFSHVDDGRFSPNARWVAYHSNQSGIAEIYVSPFPPTGERWQISQSGGVQPRWSDRGDELFFLNLEGRLMAAKMPDSDPRRAAAPEPLFMTGVVPSDSLDQFAPLRDQFLVRSPVTGGGDTPTVQVLVNWTASVPR